MFTTFRYDSNEQYGQFGNLAIRAIRYDNNEQDSNIFILLSYSTIDWANWATQLQYLSCRKVKTVTQQGMTVLAATAFECKIEGRHT